MESSGYERLRTTPDRQGWDVRGVCGQDAKRVEDMGATGPCPLGEEKYKKREKRGASRSLLARLELAHLVFGPKRETAVYNRWSEQRDKAALVASWGGAERGLDWGSGGVRRGGRRMDWRMACTLLCKTKKKERNEYK